MAGGVKYKADSLRIKESENTHLQPVRSRSVLFLLHNMQIPWSPSWWPKAIVGLGPGGPAPRGTHGGIFRSPRGALWTQLEWTVLTSTQLGEMQCIWAWAVMLAWFHSCCCKFYKLLTYFSAYSTVVRGPGSPGHLLWSLWWWWCRRVPRGNRLSGQRSRGRGGLEGWGWQEGLWEAGLGSMWI